MAAPCEVLFEATGIRIAPRKWHRILSLSRGFAIPIESIERVDVRSESIKDEFSWRGAAVYRKDSFIPGKYKAGTFRFMRKRDGVRDTTWWLVSDASQTIELGLRGFRYDRVIVQVDDPDGTGAQIRALIGGRNPG